MTDVKDIFGAVGSTLKDEFRIDAAVAEGGFGLVYRATHVGLDRPVAVKVLKTPPEYNDEARKDFMARFKEEARTVLKVRHPAVVQVLDFGVSKFPNGEEAAWTAMEWVEGVPLEDELRARRRQGGRHPVDVLALLKPVFEAVAVAHDEGIAHRDLKPANIMVVRGKRNVTVRLLDFGIAKTMEAGEAAGSGRTRTASANIAFSPRYAAPEQLAGARTGPWTDVHALAMIATEVLTDRPCYAGRDSTALFAEALSPERPTPARRSIDVGAWEAVLAKALSLRPDDRHANAGELLAALEATLRDAKHTAPPESAAAVPGVATQSGNPNAPLPPVPVTADATSPTKTSARAEQGLAQTEAAPRIATQAAPRSEPPKPTHAETLSGPPRPLVDGGTVTGPEMFPPSLSTTGNGTLRGMSHNVTPAQVEAAPAPARKVPAAVWGVVVAAALGGVAVLALARRDPSSVDAPARIAAPHRVSPEPARAAATPMPAVAPVEPAPSVVAVEPAPSVAPVQAAAAVTEDAGAAEAPRRRHHRSHRSPSETGYQID